eukprot:364410-Chlamydomonas_euryale.AAC.11
MHPAAVAKARSWAVRRTRKSPRQRQATGRQATPGDWTFMKPCDGDAHSNSDARSGPRAPQRLRRRLGQCRAATPATRSALAPAAMPTPTPWGSACRTGSVLDCMAAACRTVSRAAAHGRRHAGSS